MKISILKKQILLPNSTNLSLFVFNENKYIKIFTPKKSCYFLSKNIKLKFIGVNDILFFLIHKMCL
jgi:hypothetical protein